METYFCSMKINGQPATMIVRYDGKETDLMPLMRAPNNFELENWLPENLSAVQLLTIKLTTPEQIATLQRIKAQTGIKIQIIMDL